MTDRPNVERLLNEWWQEYTEHDVRTRALVDAIEADRAAGLLRVPEAIAGQDVRGWHQAAHSLHAEVERLAQWKAEANEVLGAWTSVWVALGQPGQLGDSIAAESLAEVERLREMHDNAAVRFEAQRHLTDLAEEHAERAEAKLAEVVEAIEALPGPGNVGIKRWPERDQEAYLLAIEEAAQVVRAVLGQEADR